MFGFSDPATGQVGIDAVGYCHRGVGHARHAAGRDDLRLELGAVFASAATAALDFVGDSVHVSTKNLVDTSILEGREPIKEPRPDAYSQMTSMRIIG